jgi:hypothetical protein
MNKTRFADLFPVTFYNELHPDFGVNFQMNRCCNFSNDEDMLTEMQEVSSRIHDYGQFIREFYTLYEKSIASGHKLRTAHYLRTAEFYMTPDNPQKDICRKVHLSCSAGLTAMLRKCSERF